MDVILKLLTITDSHPRESYIPNYHLDKDNLHWGQRKLLMSEILYLLMYTTPTEKYNVIYVGAADGLHINVLVQLFPNVTFYLFDYRQSMSMWNIKESKTVHVYNMYLINDIKYACAGIPYMMISELITLLKAHEAHETHETHNLFISDLRTANPDIDKHVEHERKVLSDTYLQFEMAQAMNCPCMIKWRCLFVNDKTPYLKHPSTKILMQCYERNKSSETRLICDDPAGASLAYANDTVFEQIMFYHNIKTRFTSYRDIVATYTGTALLAHPQHKFDVHFDNYIECLILIEYIRKYNIWAISLDKYITCITNSIKTKTNFNFEKKYLTTKSKPTPKFTKLPVDQSSLFIS
jgi:hypothetical protein